MLLRRLKAHVETENWFAVFLDFAIVVIGVFIGIQVANWNEVRLERIEEAAIIERLREDFTRIKADSDASLLFDQTLQSDLASAVIALRAGELPDEEIAVFERALFLGPVFQTSADRSGTFTELLASGRANILRDKELLKLLNDYNDFLERYNAAMTYLIQSTVSVQGAFNIRFDLDVEGLTYQTVDVVNFVAPIKAYNFEQMADDPAFINAAEQLALLHSTGSLWRARISQRVEAIQQRLEAVSG
jgi:hypothetical protein